MEHGLCKECKQPNTSSYRGNWCQSCNANHFQQNFNNWTSENRYIDEFIQNAQLQAKNKEEVLEYIEYGRFKEVGYLARGGFGTTYKAIWNDGPIEGWDSENNQWRRRKKNHEIALKCLHNSQDITVEFLREVKSHLKMNNASYVIHCYGITKDPETNNFMIVMDYAENGSLRHHLNKKFDLLDWKDKLEILHEIAAGLKDIHHNELIHRDFHCGNILSYNDVTHLTRITDLGLCQPANIRSSQSGDKQIFGVLPYVAPEVLRGKEYTQASDIYAFGIIAYEVCTGFPPYHDMSHENFLAIRICQGLRPKSNYKIPQLILDVITQCWNADHSKRHKAEELHDLVYKLLNDAYNKYSLLNKQCKETDEINKQLSSSIASLSSTDSISYTTHPKAVYTSRLLDFKNLPDPKNADDIDNSLGTEYSESIRVDFTKINTSSKGKSD